MQEYNYTDAGFTCASEVKPQTQALINSTVNGYQRNQPNDY